MRLRAAVHRWQVEPHEPGAWTQHTDPRRNHPFKAGWSDTLALMDRELAQIGATGTVALQLDIQRGRVRRDGLPGADVKTTFPGVAISFDSERGPLTYRVDTFTADGWQGLSDWQANFRAIALTLEALRAVSRYGGAELGQQYTGWAALPSGHGGLFTSTTEARTWLTAAARQHGLEAQGEGWAGIVRRLSMRLHEDTSTLEEEDRRGQWDRLQEARRILSV